MQRSGALALESDVVCGVFPAHNRNGVNSMRSPALASDEIRNFMRLLVAQRSASTTSICSRLDEAVLHVSEGCNLTCSYCFAGRGQYGSDDKRWMSPETASRVVALLAEKYDSVARVKFFGGEPFMNQPAMRTAMKGFAACVNDGSLAHVPKYGAVSNLTLGGEAIYRLINEGPVIVTASVDGPREIHDTNRRFAHGQGSFDRICRTIREMKNATGQPSAIETVFSRSHLAAGFSMRSLHEFLSSEFDVGVIIMSPVQEDFTRWPEAEIECYQESLYENAFDYGRFLVAEGAGGEDSGELIPFLKGVLSPPRGTFLWVRFLGYHLFGSWQDNAVLHTSR